MRCGFKNILIAIRVSLTRKRTTSYSSFPNRVAPALFFWDSSRRVESIFGIIISCLFDSICAFEFASDSLESFPMLIAETDECFSRSKFSHNYIIIRGRFESHRIVFVPKRVTDCSDRAYRRVVSYYVSQVQRLNTLE